MQRVCYVTGLNGSLDRGLAAYLKSLVTCFSGIELNDTFNKRSFHDRVKTVRETITDEPLVIATSFGGYLTLNALIDTEHEIKELILFSPVLGIKSTEKGGGIPPSFVEFKKAVTNSAIRLPQKTTINTGSIDPVCPPENTQLIKTNYPFVRVKFVEDAGHFLPHNYVQDVIHSIGDK